ncbi:DNA-binding transcriptional regulator, AcrR family [Raineyella antarctica]|uniref:DNA-binding transcriptional regulator, AcrR family n=1 Tax=Raineyella antarctica TaxID=1577474 RepID=A0A1G6GH07_9ACTN|nr:TetR/AcrR family transcriptional regulator [Raineyella antarctica]SDB81035.1 DNA-binding transcriptional regulator, AcrR family [Raineyella antarctica]
MANGRRDEELSRDAVRTRAEILQVATAEFARSGLSGARVDEIAALTRTTKRMIYYYFGGKGGLYAAVLEEAYAGIRRAEQKLDLAALSPVEAMRTIVEFGFDYHAEHPELGRLVSIENIHHAEHLRASERQIPINTPVLAMLDEVLARGWEDGSFRRPGVRSIDVHLMAMSWAIFQVTNRPTIEASFGHDMAAPENRATARRIAVEAILAWLRTTD